MSGIRFGNRSKALALGAVLAISTALLAQQSSRSEPVHQIYAPLARAVSVAQIDPRPQKIAPLPAPPPHRTIQMEVTAYCPCTKCCGPGARGITASGKPVSYNGGAFVAADTRVLPFNTQLSIPGYRDGKVVPVIDRGGAIKGNRLDVFFASHDEARRFGRRTVEVTVY